MNVSTLKVSVPEAMSVEVTEDTLTAELSDGRILSVPLSWYPRLIHATPEERQNWQIIGAGEGIHWPALDISVECCWAAGLREKARDPSSAGWKQSEQGAQRTIHEIRPAAKEDN